MFLALRELQRNWRRYSLLGAVIGLVAILLTILSGLAAGLVTDGISGLRALPVDHVGFSAGSQATFSRSIVHADSVDAFNQIDGVEATPLGMTFANAQPVNGGPSLDVALFGVTSDSFLLPNDDARAAVSTDGTIVLSADLEPTGVKVGDVYRFGAASIELKVVGFTFAGSYGHAPIAYTSLPSWKQIMYGNADTDSFSAVAVRENRSVDGAAVDAVAAKHDLDLMTKKQSYAGSPGYSAETGTMNLIKGFLVVISALVIGAFFTVLTVQRTRQIGVLKALGASNLYVIRDGLAQALVLVTVATGVGVMIGVGALALIGRSDAPVELATGPIIGSAIAMVIAGVLGSLFAMKRITNIEPAIALGVES